MSSTLQHASAAGGTRRARRLAFARVLQLPAHRPPRQKLRQQVQIPPRPSFLPPQLADRAMLKSYNLAQGEGERLPGLALLVSNSGLQARLAGGGCW